LRYASWRAACALRAASCPGVMSFSRIRGDGADVPTGRQRHTRSVSSWTITFSGRDRPTCCQTGGSNSFGRW
jgi:hypothetical protein